MNFAEFATAANTRTTANPRHVAFLRALADAQVRVTYGASHVLRYGRRPTAQPSYKALLEALPPEMQYIMCREDGGYHPNALEAWGHLAPEGFMEMPRISMNQIQAAYAAWLAETETEGTEG